MGATINCRQYNEDIRNSNMIDLNNRNFELLCFDNPINEESNQNYLFPYNGMNFDEIQEFPEHPNFDHYSELKSLIPKSILNIQFCQLLLSQLENINFHFSEDEVTLGQESLQICKDVIQDILDQSNQLSVLEDDQDFTDYQIKLDKQISIEYLYIQIVKIQENFLEQKSKNINSEIKPLVDQIVTSYQKHKLKFHQDLITPQIFEGSEFIQISKFLSHLGKKFFNEYYTYNSDTVKRYWNEMQKLIKEYIVKQIELQDQNDAKELENYMQNYENNNEQRTKLFQDMLRKQLQFKLSNIKPKKVMSLVELRTIATNSKWDGINNIEIKEMDADHYTRNNIVHNQLVSPSKKIVSDVYDQVDTEIEDVEQ